MPLPGGIGVAVNENARTVVELVDIVNPASPAAPPNALATVSPLTLNWKPKMGVDVLYKIAIVVS